MKQAASHVVERIPPQLLVVFSRSLQTLAAPIVALLVTTADSLSGEIEHAISLCNVLFVGNLCASLLVLGMFGPSRISQSLRDLSARQWLTLLVFAALSALLSGLIFMALASTSVTNVILLARLGPVLFVLGSAALLGVMITRSEWLGFSLIGLGIGYLALRGSDFMPTLGDVLILVSALVYAAVTMLAKYLQPQIGMPALVFVRNGLSALIFFVMANVLFGPQHFMDAFYGPLWAIMMIYALVVIVLSQFAWYRGIATLSPASVARWTFFTPVLAVGFAYLVNGEQPSTTQLVALALVMCGIVISNIGKLTPKGNSDSPESSVAAS